MQPVGQIHSFDHIPSIQTPTHQESPQLQRAVSWNEHAIKWLDTIDEKLEAALPNFMIQNDLDAVGRLIKDTFAPLREFNQWLDSNGHGAWYEQLTTALGKLPFRAIRNIVCLLYNIIEGIIYAGVHPLKALNCAIKQLISLVHALTQPKTWSNIGCGMMGASLGHSLVTGNPLSVIGIGIGGALVIAGLTAGAIKAAVEAETGKKLDAAGAALLAQAKALPESLLTGFCMGLLFGGIQRAIEQSAAGSYRISSPDEARLAADRIIKEHNLPQYESVGVAKNGDLMIKWSAKDAYQFADKTNALHTYIKAGDVVSLKSAKMIVSPNPDNFEFWVQGTGHTYDYEFSGAVSRGIPLYKLGMTQPLYPLLSPITNQTLSNISQVAGGVVPLVQRQTAAQ